MNPEGPTEKPSRSQSKRAAEALQTLGEELIALPAKQLAQVPLPDAVRAAIEQARRITSHGGLRRQRQYVGRLMRGLDAVPIRAKLEALRSADRVSRARFLDAEHWRAHLLAEGEAAVGEFLRHYPQADPAQLHSLVRDAVSEAQEGRPPARARELFRYIHGLN